MQLFVCSQLRLSVTQQEDEIEEYIDLYPVLKGLYMDKDSFLEQIKGVRIEYA